MIKLILKKIIINLPEHLYKIILPFVKKMPFFDYIEYERIRKFALKFIGNFDSLSSKH